MQSLKHLYFLAPAFNRVSIFPVRAMDRLETLFVDRLCNETNHDLDMSTILQGLGPNCKSLHLSNMKCISQCFVGTDLTNLTHLRLHSISCDYPYSVSQNYNALLKYICTHFASIASLDIDVPRGLRLQSVINQLAVLPKLTTMKLDVSYLMCDLISNPINGSSTIFPALEEVFVYCNRGPYSIAEIQWQLERALFKLRPQLRKVVFATTRMPTVPKSLCMGRHFAELFY